MERSTNTNSIPIISKENMNDKVDICGKSAKLSGEPKSDSSSFDHLLNTGTGAESVASNSNNYIHASSIYQANGYHSNASFNTVYGCNNNCSNSTSLTAPHYFSPILNGPQTFFRPLLTTQPPLYSPILSGQQHGYNIPHSSPVSVSYSTAINDGSRNGIESLNCHSEMIKELNCRPHTDNHPNGSTNKLCSVEDQKTYQSEHSCKRTDSQTSFNIGKFQSCNVSKTVEQQLFDDYAKMYGDDHACKNWMDTNNFNTGVAQSSHYKANSYNSQQHSGTSGNNFPDCRLDAIWNRATSITSETNNTFASDAHCKTMKTCGSSGILKTSEQSKATYDYQPQLSAILPFLQPIASQEEKSLSKTGENIIDLQVSAIEKKMKSNASSSTKSSKKNLTESSTNNQLVCSLSSNEAHTSSSGSVLTSTSVSHPSENRPKPNDTVSSTNFAPNNNTAATVLRSSSTSVETASVSHSTIELSQNCSINNKCSKDNLSRFNQAQCKKTPASKDQQNDVTSDCCLLCGTVIEASAHCMIDNLVTIPSKITVSDKLNMMMGYCLPRDVIPSIYVCPKCFHLINEVDVLEHRLNVCRREVLFCLETMLEKNGINLSPYKRYSRQQTMAHHDVQFPHYQQIGSNTCLNGTFQNDGQIYQGYSMDPQMQNCIPNLSQQNMQQINANMELQIQSQENFQHVHNHHIHHPQMPSNQIVSSEHSDLQKQQLKKMNDLKLQNQVSSEYQYTGNQTIDRNFINGQQMNQATIPHNSQSHMMTLNHTEEHQSFPAAANQNESISNSQLLQANKSLKIDPRVTSSAQPLTTPPSAPSDLKKVNHSKLNRMSNECKSISLHKFDETSLPLVITETANQEVSNSMSVLLSYSSVDSKEFNPPIMAGSSRMQLQYNEAVPFSNGESSLLTNKGSSEGVAKENASVKSPSKWPNCEAASAFNPTECDIDIEKCDVNVDTEEILPQSSSLVSEKIHLESLNTQHSLDKSINISVSEVTDLLVASAAHQSISPSADELDILLSPESHPPPPEGPPEGLRNVQDATEYHKPTLLGKNYKGKKHAKLQICRQCDQVFSNRQSLIRHIERRHKNCNTSFNCDTCHRKFNSERALKNHSLSHRTYPCKVCDKIFLKNIKLKKHLKEHSKENLTCKICSKVTTTTQALIAHLKSHERQPNVIKCPICNKQFTCKRNLDHHSRIHSGEKPFKCYNCQKSFRHKSNMITHYKLCAKKCKFTCETCCRGFALKSVYNRHVDEHEGRFPHRCSLCNKGFFKIVNLLFHVNTHPVTLSTRCSMCSQSSSCNSVDTTTTSPKTKTCPICEKVVASKDSLQDHIAQHEGRREHQCKECKASFIYRGNLQFHVQSIHRKNRPYKCTFCQKAFCRPRDHTMHIRSHTGERPFHCASCGKAFASNKNYQRHLKCHVVHVNTQIKDDDATQENVTKT